MSIPLNLKIQVPDTVYTDDRACGEFIVDINERLAEVAILEKALKSAKEEASNVMLDRLAATGQKHFAFDFGTFSQTVRTNISFPTQENGGKEKAVEWINELFDRGLVKMEDILNIQQSRISVETLQAIEADVIEYNENNSLIDKDFVPISDSPFNHYEQAVLSSPRKRKGVTK